MTSATDELRRLLDERGVEWSGDDCHTFWDRAAGDWCDFTAIDEGEGNLYLLLHYMAPAEAIDAALGRGTSPR